jgi:lysophospholipase L1-like esterase
MLNRMDVHRVERGYYEKLLNVGRRFNDLGDLPELRVRRRGGATWSTPFDSAPLVMRVDDLREVAIAPSRSAERFGVRWQSNSLGMRDRECAIPKPSQTLRVALVGESIAAGWGVNAEQGFESLLETRWNLAECRDLTTRVEVVNCAVPGHSPGQRWDHFGRVGWQVDPDMVICEVTEADLDWDERRLRYLLPRGLGWDAPVFRDALAAAGVRRDASPEEFKRVLQPRQQQILAGVYRTMIADCRSRGLPIVWVLIPRVGRRGDAMARQQLLRLAREAGFDGVLDATDAYDGIDPERLAVDADDFHPNARGHARLAARIDQLLGGRAGVERMMRPEDQDRSAQAASPVSRQIRASDLATASPAGGRSL